ncbi:Metabotropic Glutamate Receptor 3 [Manis pentadactyla]|nr:Metabotropic Glutamate Receptor 3 [Manis pentadactyla]
MKISRGRSMWKAPVGWELKAFSFSVPRQPVHCPGGNWSQQAREGCPDQQEEQIDSSSCQRPEDTAFFGPVTKPASTYTATDP